MPKQPPTSLRIVIPVMLVYAIISTIGILHHEIWLDEAQHFLIARDSNSLAELSTNMRYDGHVQLWNWLLFFITHYISNDVLAMQLFHVLIINVAAFLFLRYAQFDLLIKILVLLSYYFLFEYSLISRNYALGIMLLFACCWLLANVEKNIIAIGILLILLCNTHVFFLFTAIGIFLSLFYKHYLQKKILQRSFLVFALLFLTGMVLAAVPILQLPADNSYFHPGQENAKLFSNSGISFPLYSPARGFFPLQWPEGLHYWNTYFFDWLPAFIKIPVALVFLAWPVWVLRKNKPALFFYTSSAFLLLLFLFLSQMKGNRYFGMFFIYFLAAAWMAGNQGMNIFSIAAARAKGRLLLLSTGFFILLLLLQVAAGVYAYSEDIRRPFSMSKETVNYIQQRELDKQPVLIDGYVSGPPISAYLKRPVFYLDIDQPGSYCHFKQSYFHVPPIALQQEIFSSQYASGLDSFILVTVRPTPPVLQNDSSLYTFTTCAQFINGNNRPWYYVYQVWRNKAGE